MLAKKHFGAARSMAASAMASLALAAFGIGLWRNQASAASAPAATQPAGLIETRTGKFDAYWHEPAMKDFAREIEMIYQRYGDPMPQDIQSFLISGIRAQSAGNESEGNQPIDNHKVNLGSWADEKPAPAAKPTAADQNRADVKNDNTYTYHIYVPDSYKPGQPYGLLVWMFPTDGQSYDDEWTKTLDRYHLIWIAPDMAGKTHNRYWRAFLALYAIDQAKHRFTIDEQRIYVGGNSSGGYQASEVDLLYPQMISGGVFDGNVAFYKAAPVTGRDGWSWNGFLRDYKVQGIDLARRNERIAIIADASKPGMLMDKYQGYAKDGFANLTLIDTSNGARATMPRPGGNTHNPVSGSDQLTPRASVDNNGGASVGDDTMDKYEKGILALDAPLMGAAETTYKTAQMYEKSRRLGDACVNYALAAAHAGNKPWAADAQSKADALRKNFDDEIAQIQQLTSDRQFDKALTMARSMLDPWGKMGHDRIIDLLHEIADTRAGKPAVK